MRRDWSALPTISDVAKRLPNDADYANFRLVCTSWLSAAPKRPELPRLLVQYSPLKANSYMKIHNIADGELYSPRLPEGVARDKYICGSSRGWIALLEDPPGISLHNPCTGAHTRLPLLTHLPERLDGRRWQISGQGYALYDPRGRFSTQPKPFQTFMPLLIDKIVLSSDPMDEKCVAMALFYYGGNLMHCRPGDANHWVGLSRPLYGFSLEDMIFYNGQFYAVSNYRMFVCSTGSPIEVTEVPPANPLFPEEPTRGELEIPSNLKSYIVVSSGNLLLVTIQEIRSPSNLNPGHHCEVFRVGLDDEQLRLYKQENLDGRSLFLGGHSMSFSGESFPIYGANCIYFRSDFRRRIGTRQSGPHVNTPVVKRVKSMKVYTMADGMSSYTTGIVDDCSRAFWLTPSLCH